MTRHKLIYSAGVFYVSQSLTKMTKHRFDAHIIVHDKENEYGKIIYGKQNTWFAVRPTYLEEIIFQY